MSCFSNRNSDQKNHSEIKHTCCTVVVTIVPVFVFEEILATWVPAKAKNRKEIVPTSSPMTATVWPRVVGGRRCKSDRSPPEADVGASVFMVSHFSSIKY